MLDFHLKVCGTETLMDNLIQCLGFPRKLRLGRRGC